MQELEYKFLVNKEKFEDLQIKLLQMFPEFKVKEVCQINYYYDTKNYKLSKSNVTLRVREKNGKFSAELKKHISNINGLSKSSELIKNISKLPSQIIINQLWNEEIFDEVCKYIGKLTTLRKSYFIDGVEIDFDENNYLETTDFEIEIEYNPEYEELVKRIIKQLGLIPQKNSINKSQRFFKKLG